jgi:hypothetical protein
MPSLMQAGTKTEGAKATEPAAADFMFQVEWQRSGVVGREDCQPGMLTNRGKLLLEATSRSGAALRCLITGVGAPGAMRALGAIQRALAVEKVSKVRPSTPNLFAPTSIAPHGRLRIPHGRLRIPHGRLRMGMWQMLRDLPSTCCLRAPLILHEEFLVKSDFDERDSLQRESI